MRFCAHRIGVVPVSQSSIIYMTSINFNIVDNHIIADIGGRKALIDTGSPATIGTERILIDGRCFEARDGFMGVSLKKISEDVVVDIDWLVGADVLSNFCVEIDWLNRVIKLDERSAVISAGIPLRFVMGVPVIDVQVGNNSIPMFLDTGAKISYAHRSLIAALPVTGSANDFYPGLGSFETRLHQVEVTLFGKRVVLSIGELPSLLEMTLLAAGVKGIIGNDIFNTFPKIIIDYKVRRLAVN